ncbi:MULTISPECIES: hypothetical protein [Lachnospiraceae]|jgi:hypothetical protein|uniref:CopG-like ribbon-helix-helix domain-containing protein n=2 Tax=Lachnospiraceae TaxID=186803 RepID=A0A921LF69_9FIRM|nr:MULTISPECIES: hypothetical protein [Lachnospiraceae]MBE5063310.1 hypothetical protein [Claveliimonas monacensis]OUQ48484.1 hypothetical protein B5E62_13020 [Lachnoclostridium sp. An118]HJF93267.1 hypothetical protein [Lachnoclostridium phocaeense]
MLLEKENKAADKSKVKKQVPLRLSKKLYDEIAQWAEDDFRSMNGQIEYLLTECVKHRKGKKDL